MSYPRITGYVVVLLEAAPDGVSVTAAIGPFPTAELARSYAETRDVPGQLAGAVTALLETATSRRTATADNTADKTVHYLRHRVVACHAERPELAGTVPGSWPAGNLWSSDWTPVTCTDCLKHRPRTY